MLGDTENYLEIIFADEKKKALHRAISELKSEYRHALYLCYFENMAVSDMALLLKKKPSQISDLLYHAKKSLHAIILKGGAQYEILRTGT